MVLEFVQQEKDLFSAKFDICLQNASIGFAEMTGHLGSMEGIWAGKLNNTKFEMCFDNRTGIQNIKTFRPYKIILNDSSSGFVYQTSNKCGLLSKYDFEQISMDNIVYNLFPIGFGTEGSKNPIYCGEQQIALVEKDCKVINDLHKYLITAISEESAVIAVLFCCYMFVNACYKPGTKITSSVEKVISTTKNKTLLDKYNPQFKEKYK